EGLPIQRKLLDFDKNPQALNPPWNYVYSANNQPDSIAGMLYPGYYLPENRAKRIVGLLEPKNDWDMESASQMILDITSSVHPTIVINLSKVVDSESLDEQAKKVFNRLKTWKGKYDLESIEATVYTRWIYFYLKNTFEDELGDDLFNQLLETHFLKRLIAPMSENESSVWWDDITTQNKKETMKEMVNLSFLEALSSLENDLGDDFEKWTWNKVHTLEHGHPIGQVEALRSYFNVGPFPVTGTRETINNMAFPYDSTGYYKTSSGPSTRRIIDFSDVENSISILPTGQSGNPFSKHYKDQAQMYIDGEFRKMLMNREEIEKGKEILIFSPKE
ncbi:MAG: penicillin acylase family protein, partial [Maribacter sp.]